MKINRVVYERVMRAYEGLGKDGLEESGLGDLKDEQGLARLDCEKRASS